MTERTITLFLKIICNIDMKNPKCRETDVSVLNHKKCPYS